MPLATTRPQGVVVVGAGLVGLTTAWLLSRQGHRVTMLDPALAGTPPSPPVAAPPPWGY